MQIRRHPFLWILALIGALIFGWSTWQDIRQTGPSDTIHREQAAKFAANFLRQQGIAADEMLRTELYQGDSAMDAYLQRHDLMQQFESRKTQAQPLSYWVITFQRPQKDSYKVWVQESTGQILGYEFNPPTGSTPEDNSRQKEVQIAFREIARHGVSAANVQYIGSETEARNHLYKFKDLTWNLGQSELIHTIRLTDGQVTGYRAQYDIPEEDANWLAEQGKSGTILTIVSLLGMLLMVVFSITIAFSFPKREVDWNRGLILSLLLLAIGLLTNLNTWPELITGFDRFRDWPIDTVLWGIAILIVVTSLLTSVSTYITAVAGGVLAKYLWPDKWLLKSDPVWPDRIRAAAFRGYLLAFVWLGLQTVFYAISARYFGVWYESDFSMTPWNFLIPGLFPILAWTAGISEEITFRLLGIGLVKRYLRSTFLALLLPAMVWALAHSLYPVHPYYTRFIELTLLGILIGWFFLKYDLETVIFAHIIIDTILMSVPLLSSGTVADRLWAVAWLILPAVIGANAHLLQPRRMQAP